MISRGRIFSSHADYLYCTQGLDLDEPKEKNNGCVQGKTYFVCKKNYGMFVRQTQIKILSPENSPENVLPDLTMAPPNVKVGQRVEVIGKEVFGKIAYIGSTQFAAGKWIGKLV